MSRSRAVLVLGMHRSGTSAIARGLQALSVYLGDDFLDAQPENPTGYWEDRGIVAINERLLKSVGTTWDGVTPIDPGRLEGWRTWRLRRATIRYLRGRFTPQPLWGFKDPRTVRLLPFWLRVLHDCDVDGAYLLVIRNPSSVAASLHARQRMDLQTAQHLWLAYLVPFLDRIAGKPLVVVDYDLFITDPRAQLQRIARMLEIRATIDASQVDRFVGEFLDEKLRHTFFSPDSLDASTDEGRLTRDAYGALHELAADRSTSGPSFWSTWERIQQECRTRFAWPSIA